MVKKYLANKDLGQHFLKNPVTIKKICESVPKTISHILEVGPGPGVLTETLKNQCSQLTLIETDERFISDLKNLGNHIEVFHQDALKFDFEKFTDENSWIVSNLPYNISVPLTMNFIKSSFIEGMTLMYQKEVGEKFLEKDKTNLLYMSLAPYFETKKLMTLKPGAFLPPPEVDSIVIVFNKRKEPLLALNELERYKSFVRSTYSVKRKQIKKHMKTLGFENIELIFEKFEISLTARAENLKLNQIISLYKELYHGR